VATAIKRSFIVTRNTGYSLRAVHKIVDYDFLCFNE